MSYSWECPFCKHNATIGDGDTVESETFLTLKNVHGDHRFECLFTVCPNKKCKEFTLEAHLYRGEYKPTFGDLERPSLIKYWRLVPPSEAKTFPKYIPQAILNDYEEACKIVELSPKASATLSRRSLQTMIRDFWGVTGKSNLAQEIDAIKDKIEPLTWEAIDAVRHIGNIGAHMERDIDLIVDVEPEEASILIKLTEDLIQDWYINKHERKKQLEQIVEIKNKKKEEQKK